MKKALYSMMVLLLVAVLPALSEAPESDPILLTAEAGAEALAEADIAPDIELAPEDVLPDADDAGLSLDLPDVPLLDALIDLDIPEDSLENNRLNSTLAANGAVSNAFVLLEPEEENSFIESSRDSDALFAGYANSILHGDGTRFNATTYALDKLNPQEQLIYDTLKPLIAQVAEGNRTSTEFTVPVSTLLGMTCTTGQALIGAPLSNPMTDDEKRRAVAAWNALYTYGANNVTDALWFDCTYELFWLDRYENPIRSVRPAVLARYRTELGDWELYVADDACVTFCFPVLRQYQGDIYTLAPSSIERAKTARDNAKAIVDRYAGCSDYARLGGYVMEICELVNYDYEAATPDWWSANPQVQDPWKLIWVFDGDTSTNVVCEGYSQAFQYLCELTEFEGDIRCRLVTGYADGEEHSWNLVRMDDGKNYLVDVTWMDGSWDDLGNDLAWWISNNWGDLFLCGGNGSVFNGYEILNRSGSGDSFRRYRTETLNLYPDAALALAPQRYIPTGFHRLPDGIRYFNEDGALTCGEALLDGIGYEFDSDGILKGKLSGWHTVDGEILFFEADGRLHSDHTVVVDAAVAPGCTEPGLTEGSHCSVCEAVLTAQKPVKALGHRWGKAGYTWSDDLSAVTARRTCLNDPDHEQTETAQTSASVTRAPTCTARGVTTYAASFENTAFSVRKKAVRNIPATGHSWNKPDYTWSDDLSSVTARRTCLNDPNHVQVETVQTSARVTRAPTCTARGVTTYTARFRRSAFATQKKRLRNIPATGHKPVTDPAVPATRSAEGLTEGSHCAVCGKVLTAQKPIPRLVDTLHLPGSNSRRVNVGEPLQIILDAGQAGSYRSSNPRVASIDRRGLVDPLSPGTTTITIRLRKGGRLRLRLTVVDPHAPESVRIRQGRFAALKVGQRLSLKTALSPDGARSTLYWTSSNPGVASVDRSGKVRGLKPGRAMIIVHTYNGKGAAIAISVRSR